MITDIYIKYKLICCITISFLFQLTFDTLVMHAKIEGYLFIFVCSMTLYINLEKVSADCGVHTWVSTK